MRAAASSIASGSPSSARQTSHHAAVPSSSRSRPRVHRRGTNSSTASARASGSQLVDDLAVDAERSLAGRQHPQTGDASSTSTTTPATSSTTCSQLSITTSSASGRASRSTTSARHRRARLRHRVGDDRRTRPRREAHEPTPPPVGHVRRATSIASRVLPTPAGPTMSPAVLAHEPRRAVSSARRPTSVR